MKEKRLDNIAEFGALAKLLLVRLDTMKPADVFGVKQEIEEKRTLVQEIQDHPPVDATQLARYAFRVGCLIGNLQHQAHVQCEMVARSAVKSESGMGRDKKHQRQDKRTRDLEIYGKFQEIRPSCNTDKEAWTQVGKMFGRSYQTVRRAVLAESAFPDDDGLDH